MRTGQDQARRARWRPFRTRTAAVTVAVLTLAACGTAGSGAATPPSPMSISSEAFIQGALGQQYTCHGAKVNPPLTWSGAPQGTKSVALVVDDSSAPITPYIYWLVFDINPGATDIQEGSLPTGARQAQNSKGTVGYAAPCPGSSAHSYRFTVYALRRVLTLPNGAPLLSVWAAIAAATIGRGRIVVTGHS